MSAKVLALLAMLLPMSFIISSSVYAGETTAACVQSSDTLSEEEYNEIHEQGD